MQGLKRKSRIVLVDDHPMMIDGLTMRINAESGWEVCGVASTEDDGFAIINKMCPDLVLVDIALGDGNGIELIKQVRAKNATVRFLAISAYKEALFAERALRAGAMGYLSKQETNEKLVEAIRSILNNQRFLSEDLKSKLVNTALGNARGEQDPIERLSDREHEVFRLIGEGLTTGAIAERLFLSTHTIDTYREHLKQKLNVSTAAELSRLAFFSMIKGT